MIITKAPFRVSFLGGGCDYKEFYSKHKCFIFGGTINKYVYVSVRKKPSILEPESTISYSIREQKQRNIDIVNPIVREVLRYFKINFPVDIHVFSDIPSRTGLGGSSSFCASLVKACSFLLGMEKTKKEISDISIKIEREVLLESGGIQDQIFASYGGLVSLEIELDGTYKVKPIPITKEFKNELEDSLLLIYSGKQRSEIEIASSYKQSKNEDVLKVIQGCTENAFGSFISEDLERFGYWMKKSWEEKKKIDSKIQDMKTKEICDVLEQHKVYGYKNLGSGGGGFVLSVADKETNKNLREVFGDKIYNFKFEGEGVSNVFSENNIH